jgi:hypothetical protein
MRERTTKIMTIFSTSTMCWEARMEVTGELRFSWLAEMHELTVQVPHPGCPGSRNLWTSRQVSEYADA